MLSGNFFGTLRFKVIPAVILALLAGAALADASMPDDGLVVFPGGTPRFLERVITASGERYEAKGDPSTFFESKGPDARLSIDGRVYSKYVLIRGSSESEDFTLTVDGRNYTMKSAVSASGAKYEAEDDPSTVLWSKGEAAMLTIAGEEYQGYDVWTSDGVIWLPGQNIPTGVEWKVTSIAGLEVIPGSSVTITFHPHGKLSGKASVNNYTSSWITSGYRLKITGGVSTQKAGPQNLMDQEERFLKFLSQVDRFEFRREGLALVDKDDEEILLRR